MRSLRFFALVGIFSVLLTLPTQAVETRTIRQLTDDHPNYVVIGAFRIQRNATRFTNHAQKDLSLNAKYELNKNRNLYYVYVLNTSDREAAIAEALRLRAESEFKDTWVYSGSLGKLKPGQEAFAGIDINPATNRTMNDVSTSTEASLESQPFVADAPGAGSDTDTSPSAVPVVPNTDDQKMSSDDEEIQGKKFYFNIMRALDSQPVEGDVDVIDIDKVKKLGTYKGNMDVRVAKPAGKSGKVSLVCEVFGYRKVQREVDFNNPSGEGIESRQDGAVTVPFELARLQKGDVAVMYHVYFFKDAGVMRPESRYEVTSLLEMLKENPAYEIKIHGHTNGKASGKIISLDDESTNYFSLSKTKEGFGSAKKLSEERADVIRRFLISNGVDASRMHVKAWGGKRPIHDKHSTRAQENVRVEIEIVKDK